MRLASDLSMRWQQASLAYASKALLAYVSYHLSIAWTLRTKRESNCRHARQCETEEAIGWARPRAAVCWLHWAKVLGLVLPYGVEGCWQQRAEGNHRRSELLNSFAAFKPRSRKPSAAAAPRRGDGPVEAGEAVTLVVSAASLPPGGAASARLAAGGGPMYIRASCLHQRLSCVCARVHGACDAGRLDGVKLGTGEASHLPAAVDAQVDARAIAAPCVPRAWPASSTVLFQATRAPVCCNRTSSSAPRLKTYDGERSVPVCTV